MTHSLTMSWKNTSSVAFQPSNVSHTHGTDATFTPSTLQSQGSSSVFVDQSANLGPGPVGVYTWASQANPNNSVGCSYNHPSGTGQTTVTVTPSGFAVSFDGSHWSTESISIHPTGSNITQNIYVTDLTT
jgi:hypothetical protein